MRDEHLRLINQLETARSRSLGMGGKEAVERQHAGGKLTCRERIDLLLDRGSFVEYGLLAQSAVEVPGKAAKIAHAGGVVIGTGMIDGRRVFVLADDATVASGARGPAGMRKSSHIVEMALKHRFQLISLLEASAGRVQDMTGSRLWAGLGFDPHTIGFGGMVDLSGMAPLVGAAMGNSVGGAAFNAMLSDFAPMVKGSSFMAVSGPPVVLGAVGEHVSAQELGGAEVHLRETGQADYGAADDADCIRVIREYLSYFPSASDELTPVRSTEDSPDRPCDRLLDIVPTNQRRPYDVYEVIRRNRRRGPLPADQARLWRKRRHLSRAPQWPSGRHRCVAAQLHGGRDRQYRRVQGHPLYGPLRCVPLAVDFSGGLSGIHRRQGMGAPHDAEDGGPRASCTSQDYGAQAHCGYAQSIRPRLLDHGRQGDESRRDSRLADRLVQPDGARTGHQRALRTGHQGFAGSAAPARRTDGVVRA